MISKFLERTALRRRSKVLLTIPRFRNLLFKCRFWYFVTLRKRLRTTESEDAFKVTLAHNLKSLRACLERMSILIKPLSVIESVSKDAGILVIGPRNEFDLILLAANGFSFRNMRGLDLISYSPKIDLGDMHTMPYPDNTWDVVLCGWTISYSANPRKATSEIVRVVKPGGIVGIAVEYSTMQAEDEIRAGGYAIQERDRLSERINSVDQVLTLFEQNIGDVIFRHDAPLKMSHSEDGYVSAPSSVAVLFGVVK